MKNRVISWILLGAFAVTTFAMAPMAAVASVSGRRLSTYLLGAGTVYSILRRKPVPALLLGAGTLYAYRRYRESKERRYRGAYYAPAYYRTAGYRSTYYGRHRYYRHYRRA